MTRELTLLSIFIVSYITIAIANSDDETPTILRVIENESDKDCYEVHKNEIQAAYPAFQTCLQENVRQFQIEYEENPKNPIDAVADYVCKNPELRLCVKRIQIRLGVCLNDENKKKLDDHIKPLLAALDASCGDEGDGQPIKDLITNHGIECMHAKKWDMISCFEHIEGVTMTKQAKTFDDMYSEEGCKQAKELENCIVTTLSTCDNDTASTFFKKVFDAFLKNSHCADYQDLNIV